MEGEPTARECGSVREPGENPGRKPAAVSVDTCTSLYVVTGAVCLGLSGKARGVRHESEDLLQPDVHGTWDLRARTLFLKIQLFACAARATQGFATQPQTVPTSFTASAGAIFN